MRGPYESTVANKLLKWVGIVYFVEATPKTKVPKKSKVFMHIWYLYIIKMKEKCLNVCIVHYLMVYFYIYQRNYSNDDKINDYSENYR